ncbi:PIN domain-like protein [Lentinula raphanica]|nr:PIN domain-like protein [Lentinula raphanica]
MFPTFTSLQHLLTKNCRLLLDTFHAANRTANKHSLHNSDTTLTQLFRLLCQLSEAAVNCIFFFDGLERAAVKRGRQVIHREPDYYTNAKALIECFGYYTFTACGDAEAELADFNSKGILDAVLTKDSDVFPFGAQIKLIGIIRKRTYIISCSTKTTGQDLNVNIYKAETIQNDLELSRAGFILIALLLRSDSAAGVAGIGSKTAFGLARCGFGDALLTAYNEFSSAPSQLSNVFKQLNLAMAHEIQFDPHAKIGSRSASRADKFRNSQFPSAENLATLRHFLSPPLHQSVSVQWLPRIPDLLSISSFCRDHFNWTVELTAKRFHNELWPGLIGRMLCSVSSLAHL